MVFAGIWATRLDPATDTWHRTCSIITKDAEGVVSSIHDRMPIALAPNVWEAWLDRDLRDPEATLALLQPIEADSIMEHVVSRRVNSVKNNAPDLRDKTERETLF
jgi:putative SOS response-associated peptidase YedK